MAARMKAQICRLRLFPRPGARSMYVASCNYGRRMAVRFLRTSGWRFAVAVSREISRSATTAIYIPVSMILAEFRILQGSVKAHDGILTRGLERRRNREHALEAWFLLTNKLRI